MKVFVTRPFERDYAELPGEVKDIADKQFKLLLQNSKHPSLRIKKMEDPRGIWEGRITKRYRFTFQVQGGIYILRRIGTHDILRTP